MKRNVHSIPSLPYLMAFNLTSSGWNHKKRCRPKRTFIDLLHFIIIIIIIIIIIVAVMIIVRVSFPVSSFFFFHFCLFFFFFFFDDPLEKESNKTLLFFWPAPRASSPASLWRQRPGPAKKKLEKTLLNQKWNNKNQEKLGTQSMWSLKENSLKKFRKLDVSGLFLLLNKGFPMSGSWPPKPSKTSQHQVQLYLLLKLSTRFVFHSSNWNTFKRDGPFLKKFSSQSVGRDPNASFPPQNPVKPSKTQ